jgi:hypothetical protein
MLEHKSEPPSQTTHSVTTQTQGFHMHTTSIHVSKKSNLLGTRAAGFGGSIVVMIVMRRCRFPLCQGPHLAP